MGVTIKNYLMLSIMVSNDTSGNTDLSKSLTISSQAGKNHFGTELGYVGVKFLC